MSAKKLFSFVLLSGICICLSLTANAKTTKNKKNRTGSLYLSWGYNGEWYTRSTVHVHQSGGNDYELIHVHAHDHEGWNTGVLNKALSIPQYNYRLGYYFNKKQDLGIEINFDHTKYLIVDNQDVRIQGTRNGTPITPGTINYSATNGFYYYLNNGANFLLFNIVKRVQLYHDQTNNLRLDLTGKVGIGPVIPHVQNEFFGEENHSGFQFGGWNTGVETALRATIYRYAYVEFSQKVDYARYSNLNVYEGTAKQNFGCYELILSVGAFIPTTKHNPLFVHNKRIKDGDEAPAPEPSKQ